MMLSNSDQLRGVLENSDWWWGGYAPVFITGDGAILCAECVKDNLEIITDSIDTECEDGWRVIAVGSNAEVEPGTLCSHCGRETSAYEGDEDHGII